MNRKKSNSNQVKIINKQRLTRKKKQNNNLIVKDKEDHVKVGLIKVEITLINNLVRRGIKLSKNILIIYLY